ncbi:alkene reductase [Puniceicoccus vermicola]|uniref:Alkene reductase n=1 Tax=Puniceicoccus vermicola TaxID=388746 RepID=A0A7X1AV59_9BACT|nr:alkene reductase [Puniceicoccus vermicola]MBC2600522.1 alkene reductase [Puniceicoccus vermicola]
MKTATKSPLFQPLTVGAWNLPNRLIMAPLTRCRTGEDRVPNEMMVEYYRQRATAGLILTEATSVEPMGVGYANTPGIWNDKQVKGWKKVTEAVHAEGGRIVLQLWHVGRISDPIFLDGKLPVAPSAIKPDGHVRHLRPMKAYETPRALETEEIAGIVEAYRRGAANAKKAGFDGVELHGANGYLLDQFLQDSTNHRTDNYGGPLENRARLMFEAVDAAVDVWGADRVGLHLSAKADAHDMGDSDLEASFTYVAREAGKRGLAFLFTRESQEEPRLSPKMKKEFGGIMIANQQLDQKTAETLIENGDADAVSWGQLFIANPDLVHRMEIGAPLNEPQSDSFYGGSEEGYIDYPFYEG